MSFQDKVCATKPLLYKKPEESGPLLHTCFTCWSSLSETLFYYHLLQRSWNLTTASLCFTIQCVDFSHSWQYVNHHHQRSLSKLTQCLFIWVLFYSAYSRIILMWALSALHLHLHYWLCYLGNTRVTTAQFSVWNHPPYCQQHQVRSGQF
jgi:hypothetical protein